MVTKLGKFLRKLRIDEGEVLLDMARKLGVSASFLSAVENGNKRMPPKWNEALPKIYSLAASAKDAFTAAIADSETGIGIDFRGVGAEQRRLGVALAREIRTLPPNKVEQLKLLLCGEDQNEGKCEKETDANE